MRHNLNWYAKIADTNLCLAIIYYIINRHRYPEVDTYGGQLFRTKGDFLETIVQTTPSKNFTLQIRNTCGYTYTKDIILSYLRNKLFGIRTILVHRKDSLKAYSFIVDGKPFIDVLFSDNVITVFNNGVDKTYIVDYADDAQFKFITIYDSHGDVAVKLTKTATSAKIEIPVNGKPITEQELPLIRMYSTGAF